MSKTLFKNIGSIILFPFGFYIIPTNHISIVFAFGKYDSYYTNGLK